MTFSNPEHLLEISSDDLPGVIDVVHFGFAFSQFDCNRCLARIWRVAVGKISVVDRRHCAELKFLKPVSLQSVIDEVLLKLN